jgi:nucleotide-binding universal stress UspA family protein
VTPDHREEQKMSGIQLPVVAVGVDGSAESMVAARWAAQEATRRHLSLTLINGFIEPLSGYHPGYPPAPGVVEAMHTVSRDVLGAAVSELRNRFPALESRTASVHADPRRAIVDAAARAALTVVGSRGRGRIPELILGSVALYVASHARSPVAVVPPTADLSPAPPVGPILLAVDGSGDSQAAVGFAFDEASVRHSTLVAVTVWDDLVYRGFTKGAGLIGPLEDDEEHAFLAEQLAGWVDKYPDVSVRQVVLRGQPAKRLLGYGRDLPAEHQPQLLIVGSRGHGGVAGLLLGSVSQHLIYGSRIPVVVVRRERTN